MNKTERLLNLLKILRGYRYAVTGERLANRLGVSIRTLYRDIAVLQAMGAEIEGETGIGYILKPTFFLPPLMFSQTELQALLLGTQWVSQYGDAPLSEGAKDALYKIFDVLPASIKNNNNAFTLRVGPPTSEEMAKEDLTIIREAIAKQNKIKIVYKSQDGKETQRIIWPFTIGYFTDGRILVAWCEKKNDYQHFKTNQIISLKILNEHYSRASQNSLFREWQTMQLRKHSMKHK
jgi:predicted DNA-binding transcriptional regulator YafY